MFIRIHLPASYERLQAIKKDNFPYSTLFHAYMLAIAKLAKRENLTVLSAFGRIEHALVADTPLELSMTGDESVTLDYKEDDPEVVAFYKNSPLTNKKTTLMFMRTLLRLTAKYGNSIPELVYLIDTLPAVANQQTAPTVVNLSPVNQQVASASASVPVPVVNQQMAQAPVVNSSAVNQQTAPAPAAEPVAATTKPIDPTTMVHIKKRPGKAAMTDVVNRAHKVADKITAKSSAAKSSAEPAKESAAVSSAESANEPKPVDDVLARAERLKQEVDSGDSKAAEGEKVATNPLLKSFYS